MSDVFGSDVTTPLTASPSAEHDEASARTYSLRCRSSRVLLERASPAMRKRVCAAVLGAVLAFAACGDSRQAEVAETRRRGDDDWSVEASPSKAIVTS